MDEKNKERVMPVRWLYRIMGTVGIVLLVLLLFIGLKARKTFANMEDAVNEYITVQGSASEMVQASDYLTMQVRSFAFTGNSRFADNYFEEANVAKRRDKAVESIQSSTAYVRSGVAEHMMEALALSNKLMDTEYYSIRLVIDARGLSLARFPQDVRDVKLSAADAALSAEDKMALARSLLYDDIYQDAKEKIYESVSRCSQALTDQIGETELAEAREVSRLLMFQYIIIAVLLVLFIGFMFFNSKLVLRPMQRFVEHIEKNERMPDEGVREIRFMAASYNEAYDKIRQDKERLEYDAKHDNLTGVFNRAAYEEIIAQQERRHIGFLIIDVDYFKQINDTYGHQTGDRVLKRVANVLSQNFRSEDSICRIGGDEFAVIMVYADSSLKDLVVEKLENIARMLRDEAGGVPGVTLSIGIAFSDRKDPQGSIYEDADKALYRAKEMGRDTYAFYE